MRSTRSGKTVAGIFLALVFGVVGCGSSGSDDPTGIPADPQTSAPAGTTSSVPAGTTPSAAPSSQGPVITIADFTFTPPAAVSPGTEVTVANNAPTTHTVTSDKADAFDVSIDGGATATITAPEEPGNYLFHCNIHTSMTATLVVE